MNKQQLISNLSQNHHSFIEYINTLTADEYAFKYEQKWTAGQQLEHIVLCVKPLAKALSMDKQVLEQNFGIVTTSAELGSVKPSRTYEELQKIYVEKLTQGGKAPERFVPQITSLTSKEVLIETLAKLVADLNNSIENFSEQELDTLCLPHPLLGNITIREMLYNAIYHVQHHHMLAKKNLAYNQP